MPYLRGWKSPPYISDKHTQKWNSSTNLRNHSVPNEIYKTWTTASKNKSVQRKMFLLLSRWKRRTYIYTQAPEQSYNIHTDLRTASENLGENQQWAYLFTNRGYVHARVFFNNTGRASPVCVGDLTEPGNITGESAKQLPMF